MTKNKKKSFVLYEDMSDMFALLSCEERGILISAIFNYIKNGAEGVELSPISRMAFTCIKNTLDRDAEAYEEKCVKNRENAKKGGRPKYSEKTERLPNNFSYPYNDSDSDNENENESDIDIDSGSGSGSDSEPVSVRFSVSDECFAPATPLPPSPTGTPCLTEEERNILILEGVPPVYIREREARACGYARQHGGSAAELLRQWYKKDAADTRASPDRVTAKGKECDEWFRQKLKAKWG